MQGDQRFNNPSISYEDKQLSGSGKYDLTQVVTNDFEIEDDYEEVVQAKKDNTELNEVLNNYKKALTETPKKEVVIQDDSPKKIESQMKQQVNQKETMLGNNKTIIQSALGTELFTNVYEFLKYHRRKGTDEMKMIAELKNMVGGNRVLMSHC